MKVSQLNLVRRSKVRASLEKAQDAQRLGRWSEAYRFYHLALGKDASRFGILVQLGHMSKEMGNYPQAETHYQEALAIMPGDWDLHVQFGHLFNRVGNMAKAKEWYGKAYALKPTDELNELLNTIAEGHQAIDVKELREQTLRQMDARQFRLALPGATLLYEAHGLKDFDVILGHALREVGRYIEAGEMYAKYFDRCLRTNSKHLDDAFWHLINILNITEHEGKTLDVISKLKDQLSQQGKFSDVSKLHTETLQSQIGKMYGIFRT